MAGCTLGPLSFTLLRARKPHKGTLHLVSWKYLSYFTCSFHPVTFQLLFSLEKVITRPPLKRPPHWGSERHHCLSHSTSGGLTLTRTSGARSPMWFCPVHLRFPVCSLWDAWCPSSRRTEAEDGSFQPEIVLQRSCRNLWRKGREKMRLWVQLLQESSTVCGATCRSMHGYTPLPFLHPFIHQRTSV